MNEKMTSLVGLALSLHCGLPCGVQSLINGGYPAITPWDDYRSLHCCILLEIKRVRIWRCSPDLGISVLHNLEANTMKFGGSWGYGMGTYDHP